MLKIDKINASVVIPDNKHRAGEEGYRQLRGVKVDVVGTRRVSSVVLYGAEDIGDASCQKSAKVEGRRSAMYRRMDGLLINEQGIDATNRLALNASGMDGDGGI